MPSPQAPPPARIRREAVGTLPLAVRQELEAAVISLESARIAAAVARVAEWDAALAAALASLSAQLEYTLILEALREGA